MIDNKLASITQNWNQSGATKADLTKAYHTYLTGEFTGPLYVPPQVRGNEAADEALRDAIFHSGPKDDAFLELDTILEIMDLTYLAASTLMRKQQLTSTEKEALDGYIAGMRLLAPSYEALLGYSLFIPKNAYELPDMVGKTMQDAYNAVGKTHNPFLSGFHRVLAACQSKPLDKALSILIQGGTYYDLSAHRSVQFSGFLSADTLNKEIPSASSLLEKAEKTDRPYSVYADAILNVTTLFLHYRDELLPRLVILEGEQTVRLNTAISDLQMAMGDIARASVRFMTSKGKEPASFHTLDLSNPRNAIQAASTLFHMDENMDGQQKATALIKQIAAKNSVRKPDVMTLVRAARMRERGGC